MNLTEALTRWCELEPLRCFRGNGYYKLKWHAEFGEDEIPLELLEYAVREAIEARGLIWVTGRESKVKFIGRLFSEDTAIQRESSSSAAHALLLAYVAYLEGVMSL